MTVEIVPMVEHAQPEFGRGAQADLLDRATALHLADQREGAVEHARAIIACDHDSRLAVDRYRSHQIAFVAETGEIEVKVADARGFGGRAKQDRAASGTVARRCR